MKKHQENSEERRGNSRVERLQKNARFGEIVFTKHGVYEALPCDKCGRHHRVLYPPVMMTCEDMNSNQCKGEHLENTREPRAFFDYYSDCSTPRHSRTSLRSKKPSSSIFRGTASAKNYLSGVSCSNMGFLHSQAATSNQHFAKRSQTYPKYSKYKISDDVPLNYSSASLEAFEPIQDNGCEICLLAEESKLYHMDCRSGKTEGKVGNKGIGGFVQGTVCCPNCSQMMCFQAQNEEDLEREVKKEMLIQEEDALRQRLSEDRDHYTQTLQKLKSAEESFEKIIADVAEVVTGELKNIDKATRTKKRSKQMRKRHLNEIGSETGVNQDFLQVKTAPLRSVSSEESNVGGGQISRERSFTHYFKQLQKGQSETSLKAVPKNVQCSLSDVVVHVPNERLENVSPRNISPVKSGSGHALVSQGATQSEWKRKSGLSHLQALGAKRSYSGEDKPFPKVAQKDELTTEEGNAPKLQPCISVSSAMRKLTGTDSNPSVKKISFAEYSEGEKIKPISSDNSLHPKTSMTKFSDMEDLCITSRKTSSIIEHVDSLILLESSLSLRSGNERSKFSASQENVSRGPRDEAKDTEEISKASPHIYLDPPRIEEEHKHEVESSPKVKTKVKVSDTVGVIEESKNQEEEKEPLKLSKTQQTNLLDPTNKLDSIYLKCLSSTENVEIEVVNNGGSKRRKKCKVEQTVGSEENLRTHKVKTKSAMNECSHENSGGQETSKKCCHHFKRSQSASVPGTRKRKDVCGKHSCKKATSSSKPPPHGGYEVYHSDGYHTKDPKIHSCPPTFRDNKRSHYKQTKSSKQQCMELSAQGRDLLSANQKSLDTCIELGNRFGNNYSSRMDCVEAQSKLDNQMYSTTDSEVHKSSSHLSRPKYHGKSSCSSAQEFKTARKSTRRDNSNAKLSTSDDAECLPGQKSDSVALDARRRPQTARHLSRQKRQPNLLDQIVELHVGQAAMTDRSVNSTQHSDSDINRPIYHKFTAGNYKGNRNMKPTSSQANTYRSKADIKAKREALLQHLLKNEAQQSRDGNSSLSTMDSDIYESLHLLVGKMRQPHRSRKIVGNDNTREMYAPTQLPSKPARVMSELSPTSSVQNIRGNPQSLPVIVKTCEDDYYNTSKQCFVPRKIHSANSDSHLPQLNQSFNQGSQEKRRFLTPEQLGPKASTSSAGADKEVLEEVTRQEKYGRKLAVPPGNPRLNDDRRRPPPSSSVLPPISSTKLDTEEGIRRSRSNKKVTITANDSIPALEQGEQNESFLKRIFNSIFKP